MDEDRAISAFLHFGFLPEVEKEFSSRPWALTKLKSHSLKKDSNEARLVGEGIKVLQAVFSDTIRNNDNYDSYVLPLSGGLDSRAILGGLLEHMEASQIQTVTFGVEGTWDFEIGQQVAQVAGVRSEAIDLSLVVWDKEKILHFASRCESPLPVFESYLYDQVRVRFGTSSLFWIGCMGDALTGINLPSIESHTWEIAKAYFVNWQRASKSISLTPPGYSPEDDLPVSPLLDKSHLSYDDQLNFFLRQQNYDNIAVLLKGYEYRTPFFHPEWVDFILSVPRRFRKKQYLYKEILKKAYPKLFTLPTKTNYGLPLSAGNLRVLIRKLSLKARSAIRRFSTKNSFDVHPMTNYIDFDEELRERDDLKNIVHTNVQDLKNRGIVDWIDIDGIWRRHQNRQANHADALTLLASLEIILKVQESSSKKFLSFDI